MHELHKADFRLQNEVFGLSDFNDAMGVAISGMSQAGKSTLGRSLQTAAELLVPGITVFSFPNSNGFRAIGRDIANRAAIGDDDNVAPEKAASLVESWAQNYFDPDSLVKMYERPPGGLRANSVNKIVAHVGDNELLNIAINRASAEYLARLVKEDGYAKALDIARPHLVLMDGRNAQGEGFQKFEYAGMRNLANFVITCDEEVAIRRIPNPGMDSFETRVLNLTRRNTRDRDREVNPTSMPEDFDDGIAIEEPLRVFHRSALIAAGRRAATCPQSSPLTIATDRLRPDMIECGIVNVMNGTLSMVLDSKKSGLVAV